MTWLNGIRNQILRHVFFRRFSIGRGFHAGRGVRMWAKSELKIGLNFYIGRYSQIECDAVIGDNVIFGNFVSLVGKYDHHYQRVGVPIAHSDRIRHPDYNWRGLDQRVTIHDDVWVGLGAIVLSGVTIGEGSIIAAGSVVTRNVEPYAVYAGVPARRVASRFNSSAELQEHLRIIKTQEYRVRSASRIRY